MSVNWKKVGVKAGGVAVGTLGTKMLLKALPATVTNLYKGGGAMLLAAFLPTFVKGEFIDAVASGMMSVGAEMVATHFNFAVSGLEDSYSIDARNMAIEQANQQVAEYIGEAEQFYNEVSGDADFIANADAEFIAEEIGAM